MTGILDVVRRLLPLMASVALPFLLLACNQNDGGGGGAPSY